MNQSIRELALILARKREEHRMLGACNTPADEIERMKIHIRYETCAAELAAAELILMRAVLDAY